MLYEPMTPKNHWHNNIILSTKNIKLELWMIQERCKQIGLIII